MPTDTEKWRDELGDYALVPIPDGEKKSLLNVFLVYSGVLAVFAVIASGTSVGLQYNFQESIVVAIVAAIILTVIGGGIAYIGGITGLTTYINMRYTFGYLGAWVWGVISSGLPTGIGWFAFETWLFGVTVHQIFPNTFLSDVGVAATWGGLLMMMTAYIGYGGLSILSYLAVPMFFLISIIGFMIGFDQVGNMAEILTLQPKNPASGIGSGVTIVVGSYVVASLISMDVGRFAPKAWHAAAAWCVQIIFLMPIFVSGAAFMTLVTGESDFASVMATAGFGIGVFLMIILGFWSTNDNNLYSGALSWSLFVPLEKRNIVVIEGLIGTGIAAFVGFNSGVSMDPFVAFLDLLGKFLPAIGGVILADFYIYRWMKGEKIDNRYTYQKDSEYGLIVWPGWIATIFGATIGGWVITIGIASLNVLILGSVFYVVIMLVSNKINIPTHLGSTQINETGQSPEIHSHIPSLNPNESEKELGD